MKGYRLQPDEIPEDSKQFTEFQLQRLIERNNINMKLYKV